MKVHSTTHGYYTLTLSSPDGSNLLDSNGERAFVISLLQDTLSPRFILNQAVAHQQLSACIDLLAFSITRKNIQLVVFTIDTRATRVLLRTIKLRLAEFQTTATRSFSPQAHSLARPTPHSTTQKLYGPHHALLATLSLHHRHDDWEYDRYSSIGFYLHDRRGDWMRIWRIARLYQNDPHYYFALIRKVLAAPSADITPTQSQLDA